MLIDLKEYRIKKNIKVKDIIKVMGTQYPITYYRKENGERKFTVEETVKLSKAFKIPQEFFLKQN